MSCATPVAHAVGKKMPKIERMQTGSFVNTVMALSISREALALAAGYGMDLLPAA
jgi:hypothetical protein